MKVKRAGNFSKVFLARISEGFQFDGQQLRFPTHTEIKPVEQARYQAKWLGDFLGGGVGTTVRVVPVLALPGWYIEATNRSAKHDLLVSNCHDIRVGKVGGFH